MLMRDIGCWETIASDDATMSRYLKSHPEQATRVRWIQDIIALVQAGDSDARQALLTTASFLGQGIRGLAQGLGPEVIVIGGEITGVGRL